VRGKKAKQLKQAAAELAVKTETEYAAKRQGRLSASRTVVIMWHCQRAIYQALKRKYKTGDNPLQHGKSASV
jgi:hypothetical protein